MVIKGPSLEEVSKQIAQALNHADLVELRLDCFTRLDLADIKKLQSGCSLPMIFTLRDKSQGGHYDKPEENRLADILNLASLKPDYFDLESHVPASVVQAISFHYPEIKLIISYHNFHEMPKDLDLIYQNLRKIPAYLYKIAVKAHTSLDALRLLFFAKKSDKKLIVIGMGKEGQATRILGPIFGSQMTYASLDENQTTAPGQVNARELTEIYRYKSLNSQTEIYALIGNPVDRSVSEKTHNPLFQQYGVNAIYIKICLSEKELPEFFQLAKVLHFKGLSVTMPFKVSVLPFLDQIDPYAAQIGAINTLFFDSHGKIRGFNTDGIGAWNALEAKGLAKGKKTVVIGAGGAAEAIAYEGCRRGAEVIILNRHAEKAFQLAKRFGCVGGGLADLKDYFESGYDILINATPNPMPIEGKYIYPKAMIMDITTKPLETELLRQAREKGCLVVYGYKMFIEQALGQFAIWFNGMNSQKARKILEKLTVESTGS